jgi:type I restriction enzyme, S subunit
MSTATSTKVNCDVKRFDGEWKVSVIRKLVSTPVTDGPHSTPQFLDNGIPFLSVNNIVDNKISNKNLRHISKLDHIRFSKKCKPQRNDILLGKAATVGTVAIVDTDLEFNIWSPLALIRFGELVIPRFAYYFLQCEDIRRQIDFLTNSSSQGNIGMGDINRLSIILPPLSEQRAIASILSDMDAEIEALEKRKAKTIYIKQGMMQELLTGKTRLPERESA